MAVICFIILGLLFATSFNSEISFPIMIGYDTADTQIYGIDIDPYQNVLIGAVSSEATEIVSTANNAVVFYKSVDGLGDWAIEFEFTTDIFAVKFCENEASPSNPVTRAAILVTSAILAIIDTADGSILDYVNVNDSGFDYLDKFLLYIDSTIYFARYKSSTYLSDILKFTVESFTAGTTDTQLPNSKVEGNNIPINYLVLTYFNGFLICTGYFGTNYNAGIYILATDLTYHFGIEIDGTINYQTDEISIYDSTTITIVSSYKQDPDVLTYTYLSFMFIELDSSLSSLLKQVQVSSSDLTEDVEIFGIYLDLSGYSYFGYAQTSSINQINICTFTFDFANLMKVSKCDELDSFQNGDFSRFQGRFFSQNQLYVFVNTKKYCPVSINILSGTVWSGFVLNIYSDAEQFSYYGTRKLATLSPFTFSDVSATFITSSDCLTADGASNPQTYLTTITQSTANGQTDPSIFPDIELSIPTIPDQILTCSSPPTSQTTLGTFDYSVSGGGNDGSQYIQIANPSNCLEFTYNSGTSLQFDSIVFIPGSGLDLEISQGTCQYSDGESDTIILEFYFTDGGSLFSTTQTVSFAIQNACSVSPNDTIDDSNSTTVISNSAPYFMNSIKDEIVEVGEELKIWAIAIDDEGDDFYFTADFDGASFASFEDNLLVFDPTIHDIGSYQIELIVTENTDDAFSDEIIFTLTVMPAQVNQTTASSSSQIQGASNSSANNSNSSNSTYSNSSSTNDSVSQNHSNSNMTDLNNSIGDSEQDGQQEQETNNPFEQNTENDSESSLEDTQVKIDKIDFSTSGLLEITFSENVINLTHYSNISQEDLQILILPGQESDIENLQFTWTVNEYTTNSMLIQFQFDSPLAVSRVGVIYAQTFRVKIKYKQCSQIRILLFQKILKRKFQDMKISQLLFHLKFKMIVKLLVKIKAMSEILVSTEAVATTTLNAFVFGSFVINFALYLSLYNFRATSLNFLWSMINCQQLVMTFPLLWINFPGNALTFYSFMITISSFNVIPIEDTAIGILQLENEPPYNQQFENADIF